MSYKYNDKVVILESNIDDSTGEMLGYVSEKLLKKGAKDVFYTSIYMKKNRPAYKLTVICDEEYREEFENIIFEETTAIGIRSRIESRTCLNREIKEIETSFGPVKVKCVETLKGIKVYPEYESARQTAEKYNIPLSDVYSEISKVSRKWIVAAKKIYYEINGRLINISLINDNP